jgi:hypothetical protein
MRFVDEIFELIEAGWIVELLKTPYGYQATLSKFEDKNHIHFEDENFENLIIKVKDGLTSKAR